MVWSMLIRRHMAAFRTVPRRETRTYVAANVSVHESDMGLSRPCGLIAVRANEQRTDGKYARELTFYFGYRVATAKGHRSSLRMRDATDRLTGGKAWRDDVLDASREAAIGEAIRAALVEHIR